MKAQFELLYNNGFTETVIQEGEEDTLVDITSAINQSFRDDVSAVARFNVDGETTMVRIGDLSRVRIQVIEDLEDK